MTRHLGRDSSREGEHRFLPDTQVGSSTQGSVCACRERTDTLMVGLAGGRADSLQREGPPGALKTPPVSLVDALIHSRVLEKSPNLCFRFTCL